MKAKVVLTAAEKGALPYKNKQADLQSGAQRKKEQLVFLCAQQHWICFWCGIRMTDDDPKAPTYRTLEHLVPKGTRRKDVSHSGNFRASCKRCNGLRGQWNIGALERRLSHMEAELTKSQATIARHRTTMAYRCYFCKLRFHLREWLHKRKAYRQAKREITA